MSPRNWPPPGFPLVQGDHVLTREWMIHLPEPLARRIEDGPLVLWRPGCGTGSRGHRGMTRTRTTAFRVR